MKKITKAAATMILVMTLSAFPVLACGDMTAGSKCFVQTVPTTTETGTDKKVPYELEREIVWFVKDFFGKFFI